MSAELLQEAQNLCEAHKICTPCGLHRLDVETSNPDSTSNDGFTHEGLKYHLYDFCYVYGDCRQNGSDCPLKLGQISAFKWTTTGCLVVTVRRCRRITDLIWSEYESKALPKDLQLHEVGND